MGRRKGSKNKPKRWQMVSGVGSLKDDKLETFTNGLRDKYIVVRKDTGQKVTGCFVLRPETDVIAFLALQTYMNIARKMGNPKVASDIRVWIEELQYQGL